MIACPFATLATLATLLSTGAAADELERGTVEAIVAPILEAKRIPGAVVAVVVREELVLVEAFGKRSLEGDVAMTTDTMFQVGSITKPFTGTLLGLLVADGLLTYETTLGEVFADEVDVPDALAPITLAQLASHASGLPRNPVNRRDLPGSPSVMLPYSVAELYGGLAETALEFAPGERLGYSNLGYALLGRALEVASGESYGELLAARVARPLDLASLQVGTDGVEERLAACYWPEDEELRERDPWRFGEVVSFAGVATDAADLARFLAAQSPAAGKFAPAVLAAVHEPRVEIDPELGRAMSAGWFVDGFPGVGPVLGHGGEVDGHSACMAFVPGIDIGLVVLANLGGDSAEVLSMALMRGVLPRLLQTAR